MAFAASSRRMELRPVMATIAHAVKAMLEMDDRGFTTELTIFATNPHD